MAFSNYTGTQTIIDHNMFWSKHQAHITWSGYGTVDNSPAVSLYLKRPFDNKAQALYVPAGIYGGWSHNVVAFDSTNAAVVQALSATGDEFYRASGGNVTLSITASTIATNCTLTPTANTTVQGIEMVVADSDSEQKMYIWVDMNLWWADSLRLTDSYKFPAAGTATLSAAE